MYVSMENGLRPMRHLEYKFILQILLAHQILILILRINSWLVPALCQLSPHPTRHPITRHTGGLEMHPLFITIGNINSDIRMKATFHVWQCVAFISLPKFETHSDYQTILQA